MGRLLNGVSIVGIPFIAPTAGALSYLLDVTRIDPDGMKNYKEANLISKISLLGVGMSRSEVQHCWNSFKSMESATGRTNLTRYKLDISYCYNKLSVILLHFEDEDVFKSDPLITTPFLIAFAPALMATHRLALDQGVADKSSVCKAAKKLHYLLPIYKSMSYKSRVKTITVTGETSTIATYIGYGRTFLSTSIYDAVTGGYLLKSIRGDYENATPNPQHISCLKNIRVSTRDNLEEYFRETIAASHIFKKLHC